MGLWKGEQNITLISAFRDMKNYSLHNITRQSFNAANLKLKSMEHDTGSSDGNRVSELEALQNEYEEKSKRIEELTRQIESLKATLEGKKKLVPKKKTDEFERLTQTYKRMSEEYKKLLAVKRQDKTHEKT